MNPGADGISFYIATTFTAFPGDDVITGLFSFITPFGVSILVRPGNC